MSWCVIPQEESLPFGRGSITVLAKHIKGWLDEKTGMAGAQPYLILKVVISHPQHGQVTLRCNTYYGVAHSAFSVILPPPVAPKQLMAVVRRGMVMPVADQLDAPVEGKPVVEKYNQAEFESRLTQMCGAEFAARVLQIFADRFVSLVKKYNKEKSRYI